MVVDQIAPYNLWFCVCASYCPCDVITAPDVGSPGSLFDRAKLEKANISDIGDAACRPVYDAHSSVLRSTMTGICSFYISDSDWCLSMLLYVHARFSYHNILLSISFNALASFSVVLTLSGLLRFAIFLNPASVLPSFISWCALRLECECVGKRQWPQASSFGLVEVKWVVTLVGIFIYLLNISPC